MLRLNLFLWILVAYANPGFATLSSSPLPNWQNVAQLLKRHKFNPTFISDLKDIYETESFQQVIELNVLLYLRKADVHTTQVNDEAVITIKNFMSAHASELKKAEKSHGVSGSVVASLLWLESRYGKNQGRYHVASTFLHLLQADTKTAVKHLQANASKFKGAKITQKDKNTIKHRASKKAKWAMGELKALEKMYKRSPDLVRGLRGSFAGAFGISQFLPTSYNRWAKSPAGNQAPDLAQPDHAIHSVAFYLKDNGWQKNKSKSHKKALLRYNNSEDYANTILKLSKLASNQSTSDRMPAKAD